MTKKITLPVTFFIILLTTAICSCTRRIYIPVEHTRTVTDSTYIHRADSLTHLLTSRDTIIIRDSVVTHIKGDTIYKEAWRVRDRVSIIRDTLRIGSGFQIQQTHRDTIRERVIVERERTIETAKPLPWWQRTLMWTGAAALLLPLLWYAGRALLRRHIPKI